MMRSLNTAAAGMTAQQLNVDVIANNLANVNTIAYKRENAEFQTMLYQTLQKASIDEEGNGKPIGIQVGLGVKSSAVSSSFTQGPLNYTENPQDFALEGTGFFAVRTQNGQMYTRDGAMKVAVTEDGYMLTTSNGEAYLDTNDEPILIGLEFKMDNLNVDTSGNFSYIDGDGIYQELGIQMKIVQFDNPQGLEKGSGNLLNVTSASGQPRAEAEDDTLIKTTVRQRALESANVQVVEEMVDLITAQRAYEINSKIITASDEMLQQANALKR